MLACAGDVVTMETVAAAQILRERLPQLAVRVAEMLERAGRLLSLGESVVLDASWIDQGARREAQQVAASSHSDVVSLLCEVPEEVAAARMRERSGPSDADEVVAAAMRGDADAWPEATLVNTSLPLEVGVSHAVSCVRPNPEHRRWVRLRPLLEPD